MEIKQYFIFTGAFTVNHQLTGGRMPNVYPAKIGYPRIEY